MNDNSDFSRALEIIQMDGKNRIIFIYVVKLLNLPKNDKSGTLLF